MAVIELINSRRYIFMFILTSFKINVILKITSFLKEHKKNISLTFKVTLANCIISSYASFEFC